MKIKVLTPFSEIKEIEIKSKDEIEFLIQQGYTLIQSTKTPISFPFKVKIGQYKVKFLAEFFRDLAGFLNVGIPIGQALDELEKTTTNKKEKKILKEIKERMEQGYFLYQIFQQLDFPQEVIASTKTGEKGAVLQETFSHLATYYENLLAFQGKMKTTLIYPMFVMGLAFIIASCISIFVIPKIREFLLAIPDLPQITKMFLSLTGFIAKFWWTIPTFFVGLILIFKWILVSEKTSKIWEYLWYTKMFSLVKDRVLGQFFLEIYILLKNGVSLIEALDIIEIQNKFFKNVIENIKVRLNEGYAFSTACSQQQVFPAFIVQTIAKGESASMLPDYIKKVADFYWERIDTYQKTFGELIGHVLIVVVGVAVGLFAGVFLFSIYSVLPKITMIK